MIPFPENSFVLFTYVSVSTIEALIHKLRLADYRITDCQIFTLNKGRPLHSPHLVLSSKGNRCLYFALTLSPMKKIWGSGSLIFFSGSADVLMQMCLTPPVCCKRFSLIVVSFDLFVHCVCCIRVSHHLWWTWTTVCGLLLQPGIFFCSWRTRLR